MPISNPSATAFVGKPITFGTSVPNNPGAGDLWYEMTNLTNHRYGWPWHWDGTRWRSPDYEWLVSAQALTTTQDSWMPFQSTIDLYFRFLRWRPIVVTTNNATNYWRYELHYRAINNVDTLIEFMDTDNSPVGTWDETSFAIAQLLDVSATNAATLLARFTPVGSPGPLYGGCKLIYQYARP